MNLLNGLAILVYYTVSTKTTVIYFLTKKKP